MNKLQQIIDKCKCGIYLEINKNRDYYQTVEEEIKEIQNMISIDEIEPEMIKKMIKHNSLISLQFYPNSPVGFCIIYHYDLESILDWALKILKEDYQK